MYAVIDTNVIISALLGGHGMKSPPVQIIDYVFGGELTPLYNAGIIAEYEEVLHRPKFGFDEPIVRLMLDEIQRIGVFREAVGYDETLPDPDDRIFFETALAHRQQHGDTYLVTGNTKHFPAQPFVVTPRQMIELLEESLG